MKQVSQFIALVLCNFTFLCAWPLPRAWLPSRGRCPDHMTRSQKGITETFEQFICLVYNHGQPPRVWLEATINPYNMITNRDFTT
jgi:hypothetical protein